MVLDWSLITFVGLLRASQAESGSSREVEVGPRTLAW